MILMWFFVLMLLLALAVGWYILEREPLPDIRLADYLTFVVGMQITIAHVVAWLKTV